MIGHDLTNTQACLLALSFPMVMSVRVQFMADEVIGRNDCDDDSMIISLFSGMPVLVWYLFAVYLNLLDTRVVRRQ